MKKCNWCDRLLDDEFIQIHHLNHIHEDNRPENEIEICIKCHQRHHKECGYDTIIIKKDEYKPKTVEEKIAAINDAYLIEAYRLNYANDIVRNKLAEMFWPIEDGVGRPYIKVQKSTDPTIQKTMLDVMSSANNISGGNIFSTGGDVCRRK